MCYIKGKNLDIEDYQIKVILVSIFYFILFFLCEYILNYRLVYPKICIYFLSQYRFH